MSARTEQAPLTSAKTHPNHSKTAQNSKSIYITAFQIMNTRKGKFLTPAGTILLLIRVSIQYPLISRRFFTAELAIVSTVSMGLWEAVAAHFHHHPAHTKYVTCYLTPRAATSIVCAQLSEGHCCQRTSRERSTGPALFRIPHKGRSVLSSMALRSVTGLLCFAWGLSSNSSKRNIFPIKTTTEIRCQFCSLLGQHV